MQLCVGQGDRAKTGDGGDQIFLLRGEDAVVPRINQDRALCLEVRKGAAINIPAETRLPSE